MKKVAVITDSNSGITQSEAKKLGIHVVPMPFFVNGDTFYEDISMSQDEFYGYLAQGADVMTSQPAPDTLMKLWDSVLECYDEIVYIPMSSGLSSSCGTAMIGTVLRIKPVLQIQGEKLDAYAKVKTLKAAKSTMIKAIRHDFEERFHDPDGDNFYMHVAYTADDTEAQAFRKELETEFPGHRVDFVDPLSLSVSCHIGPGALAVAISKKVPELG